MSNLSKLSQLNTLYTKIKGEKRWDPTKIHPEQAEVSTAATKNSAPGVASTSAAGCFTGPSSELLECRLCLLQDTRDRFADIMTCHHRFCTDCLRQYLRIEISESRINISCPECSERYNPHNIRMILGDRALMEKYEEFTLRRWLAADPDCRWCPAPDCGYAVIAFGCASCPKITCGREGCGTEFCYLCKHPWHPKQTCDEARHQRRAQNSSLHTFRSSLSRSQERPCPCCATYIIKIDGSCNNMTCAVCGCRFCWLCMKEISDVLSHYQSTSDCTLWDCPLWWKMPKTSGDPWVAWSLQGAVEVDSIVSTESIQWESCHHKTSSLASAPGVASTSAAGCFTGPSSELLECRLCLSQDTWERRKTILWQLIACIAILAMIIGIQSTG